jgi:hypothetical protein
LLRSAEARGRESLLRLKSYWKATYGISDEQCHSFSPDDKSNINEKLRLLYINSNMFTAIPLSSHQDLYESTIINKSNSDSNNLYNINVLLSIMKAVVIDYNRLGIVLEGDPADFTLMIKKKRKVKAQANNNGNNIN